MNLDKVRKGLSPSGAVAAIACPTPEDSPISLLTGATDLVDG
jgi:hypothetical protein